MKIAYDFERPDFRPFEFKIAIESMEDLVNLNELFAFAENCPSEKVKEMAGSLFIGTNYIATTLGIYG